MQGCSTPNHDSAASSSTAANDNSKHTANDQPYAKHSAVIAC